MFTVRAKGNNVTSLLSGSLTLISHLLKTGSSLGISITSDHLTIVANLVVTCMICLFLMISSDNRCLRKFLSKDEVIHEQLDWVFTSLNWTTSFPNTVVHPLGRPVSDHIPCSVVIQTTIPKCKIFRFETYWIAHPGLMDIVEQAWNKPIRHGKTSNATSRLCQKLKSVRHALSQWSKKISRLKVAIDNTNKAILEMDSIADRRSLTLPEMNFLAILKKHLLRLLQYQKEYWKK